jgi:hypothetical protein
MTRREPQPQRGNFIGRQWGGQITNVAGDQVIHGGTHGTLGQVDADLEDLQEIEEHLDDVPLTRNQHAEASAAIERTREELVKPEPNAEKVARGLEDLTAILKAAGVLAGAGLALVDPIGRIALTLGAAGVRVLQLLRGG